MVTSGFEGLDMRPRKQEPNKLRLRRKSSTIPVVSIFLPAVLDLPNSFAW